MKKFSQLKQELQSEDDQSDRLKMRHARDREQLAIRQKAEMQREKDRKAREVSKIKESTVDNILMQVDAANAALDLYESFVDIDEIIAPIARVAGAAGKSAGRVGIQTARVGAKAAKAGAKLAGKAGKALVKKGTKLGVRATKFAAKKAAKSVKKHAGEFAHDLGFRKKNTKSHRNLANEDFSDAFESSSFQKLLRHGLVEKSEITRLNIAMAKIDNGEFLNLIERELVFTILEKLVLFISEDPIIFTRVNQGVIKSISGTGR